MRMRNTTTSASVTTAAPVLHNVGLVAAERVANTLQGQIWKVLDAQNGRPFIAKITSKKLHSSKTSVIDGQLLCIQEDIVKEAVILQYLQSMPNCPRSIIEYTDFLISDTEYYLIMQHGGNPMFDFIVRVHQLLKRNIVELANWKQVVQIIMKQMMEGVEFLHAHNVCHFDISLENLTLLNDPAICVMNRNTKNESIEFNEIDKIQIKLIDFGLAEQFVNDHATNSNDKTSHFVTNKLCGKRCYQSPEVRKGNQFDAAANDVWCIGVCLFMMMTGSRPWEVAEASDVSYKAFMNVQSQRKYALKPRRIWNNVDAQLMDLLHSIFECESKRISLAEMKNHPWFNDGSKKA